MNTKKLKKQMPYGACKAISEKTGYSYTMVSQVLNGKSKSIHKPEILHAMAEYIKEFKGKETEAIEAINEALSDAKIK